jgi:hypothetical protein
MHVLYVINKEKIIYVQDYDKYLFIPSLRSLMEAIKNFDELTNWFNSCPSLKKNLEIAL